QFGGSTLRYALPSAGAFAVMHAFLPPHPGPVASGDLLGANMGLLVIVGLICAIPTWYIAAYLFGLYSGKKINLALPKSLFYQVMLFMKRLLKIHRVSKSAIYSSVTYLF
ncbi:GntP, partial [Pasteurella multocida subsp. multocida str. Anand1_cattle]